MNPAAKIVEEYLRVLMIAECAAFNRGRYKRVKKAFGPTMEVWDHSAEWLSVRAGLARP